MTKHENDMVIVQMSIDDEINNHFTSFWNYKVHTIYPKKYAHGFCFAVLCCGYTLIFPYPSGLLHWHCGNLTITPVPAKQPWWIWINTSCEFIMNDCITTTKQSTTKPCAYFLGYTVLDTPFFQSSSILIPCIAFYCKIPTKLFNKIFNRNLMLWSAKVILHLQYFDLVKSRSHEIRVWTLPIALKFTRYLGSAAGKMSYRLVNRGPVFLPPLQ